MSNEQNTITLKHPIKQGDKTIDAITLRKPMAGELRGIKLLDILQMDINAYTPLLPRITSPALNESQIHQLDPADLLSVMAGVQGFFVGGESAPM